MQSYVHRVPTEPYHHDTLMECLDKCASRYPSREAVVCYNADDRRSAITFKEYRDQSTQLAAALLNIGVLPGSRVVLMGPNCLEFVVSQMALSRLGILTLLLGKGRPVDVLEKLLIGHSCCAFICHLGVNRDENEALVKSITNLASKSECELKWLITFGQDARSSESSHIHSYYKLLESGGRLDTTKLTTIQNSVQFDHPVCTTNTSGSTGEPKMVVFTHHSLTNIAAISADIMGVANFQGAVVFNDRPFTWIAGLSVGLLFTAMYGATLVTMNSEDSVLKSNTDSILQILQNEKCTHGLILPYLMHDLTSLPRNTYDLSSFCYAATGGQTIPHSLVTRYLNAYPSIRLTQIYGTTESMSVLYRFWDKNNITGDGAEYGFLEVTPSVEVKLTDDHGHVVNRGERGEINTRGIVVMNAYLDNPLETSKCLKQGWFQTGDLAVMDEEGRVKIVGRISEKIKRATVVVFPAEVENILSQYFSIGQVAVVGVPDERMSEELCACVIPKTGHFFKPEKDFHSWCADKFLKGPDGLTLQPKHYLIFEEFPKTSTGKINRRLLKHIATERLALGDAVGH